MLAQPSLKKTKFLIPVRYIWKMKTIPVVFMVLGYISGAFGQEFKFLAGVSSARYSELSTFAIPAIWTSSHDWRTGAVFGFGVELPLARRLSIDIRGLYFQKGTKFTVRDLGGEEVFWHRYDLFAISLPACLKVKFLRGSSPYILGGCEFSYILTHHDVLSAMYDGSEVIIHLKDYTRSFDFGLAAGGGMEMNVRNLTIFMEVLYHAGLKNLSKELEDYPVIKTRALAFLFGFKFRPVRTAF